MAQIIERKLTMGFLNKNVKPTNEESTYSVLPAGIYEATVKDAQVKASKNGHENISFCLEIRKDLDGVKELAKTNAKQHGRCIFTSIWYDDESNGFKDQDLNNIYAACGGLKKDMDKIQNEDDFAKFTVGKPVRIKVGVSKNTYKGEEQEQNTVFATGYQGKGSDWHKTKYPLKAQTDPFENTSNAMEINDDDVPF